MISKGEGKGEVKLLPEEAVAWPEEEVVTAAAFNGLQCPGVSPVSPHGQGGASADLFFRFLPSWVLSTPGELSVPLLCAHRGTEGVDLFSLLQSRLALSPIPLLLGVSAMVLGYRSDKEGASCSMWALGSVDCCFYR